MNDQLAVTEELALEELTYLQPLRSVRQPEAIRRAYELVQQYGWDVPAWPQDIDYVVELEVLATQLRGEKA